MKRFKPGDIIEYEPSTLKIIYIAYALDAYFDNHSRYLHLRCIGKKPCNWHTHILILDTYKNSNLWRSL